MEQHHSVGRWLKQRCQKEHLSLRQAAARTGLSHSTIQDIIEGRRPLPETIGKLAQGLGGDGSLALEDRLMVLAGYRREEPCQADYIKTISLLSPEYQRILEVLVWELAKVEGIEVGASGSS